MSNKKKTEETETAGRVEEIRVASRDLIAATREHLAYLEERGQHTSTTARKLAELVK